MDAGEALAWPIKTYFAVERALSRCDWEAFADCYQANPEFCARLLLEITRFRGRPDKSKTLERAALELAVNKDGHPVHELKLRGIIQMTPKRKWDTIASTIWDAYRIRVKGDTLRTRLFPAYLKKRRRIIEQWQKPVEAYFALGEKRHKTGC
jgi:hypothetical protein